MSRLNHTISVAPMMDYTDRHFRYLLRLLSPSALLYTEMVNAQAIIRGNPDRLLAYDPSEHPLVLQLGGADPAMLAEAARIGAAYGYDEVNLNCGCPSDRVQSGRFGACLMAEPERVAECVDAMRSASKLAVSVKCRIAIEPRLANGDDYAFLVKFVETVSAAGCQVFIVHARTAMLNGLSPKENREVPPLRYHLVERLRRDFPQLTLVVNGGIRTEAEVKQFLATFDGVMLGREICQNPFTLAQLHQSCVETDGLLPNRDEVVERYADYVQDRWQAGDRLAVMLRSALGLYVGQPGGRAYRRFISERASLSTTTPDVLRQSLRIVRSNLAA